MTFRHCVYIVTPWLTLENSIYFNLLLFRYFTVIKLLINCSQHKVTGAVSRHRVTNVPLRFESFNEEFIIHAKSHYWEYQLWRQVIPKTAIHAFPVGTLFCCLYQFMDIRPPLISANTWLSVINEPVGPEWMQFFYEKRMSSCRIFWIDTPQWNLVFNALSTRSEVPSSCTDGRANISRAEPHLSWWMNSTRGKRKICWYRRYGFDFGVSCPFKFPFLPFSSTSLLPPITEQNSWTAKCWGTTVICSSVMSNCLISTFQY